MEYVRLRSVSAGYGRSAVILKDIDLSADKGQIVCLIGPNGAGKSTLLKTMAGIIPRLSGGMLIDGRDVPETGRARARLIASVLTVLPRTEYMTVYDVVAGGRYAHTGSLDILNGHDRDVVSRAIDMTDTKAIAHKDFRCLSDGQRQRTMLARALAMEPKLLILDEPVSHLDIYYKEQVFDILKSLKEQDDISVIMSLHELSDVPLIADRVIGIGEGRILTEGTPGEVMTDDNIHRLFYRRDER